MHQIQSEEVRLLVVASGRDLTGRPLDDHAAVELGQGAEHLDRHPVVDEGLDGVDVRSREMVLVERA